MKLGVVGLPNVGKSTLFNAITNAGAEIANYPFCTIEPNVGVVAVSDERLNMLAEIYSSQKITPAYIKFVDIAGLVKGASKGEGLGNKFLSHIREVDAIVHVVRCFNDSNVTHVSNVIDPVNDMETINLELIFADIDSVSSRIHKAQALIKTGDKKYAEEAAELSKLLTHLEQGKPARSYEINPDVAEYFDNLFLLTSKPMLYVANISENDLMTGGNNLLKAVEAQAAKEGCKLLSICAKVEEELSALSDSEKAEFLSSYGINSSGLSRMVTQCYDLLGQISYLTAGEKETRAWTITKGTKAPQAAGIIHTDFEKGFIRAEVVNYSDLIEYKGFNNCKDKGKVRSEGKDYVIKDGDVVLFRFNV